MNRDPKAKNKGMGKDVRSKMEQLRVGAEILYHSKLISVKKKAEMRQSRNYKKWRTRKALLTEKFTTELKKAQHGEKSIRRSSHSMAYLSYGFILIISY